MIEKLVNNNPDSVQGETDAGPMEIAKKVNEIVDLLNQMLKVIEIEDGEKENTTEEE